MDLAKIRLGHVFIVSSAAESTLAPYLRKAPWVHLQSVGEPGLMGWRTSGAMGERLTGATHRKQWTVVNMFFKQVPYRYHPKKNSWLPLPTLRHLWSSVTSGSKSFYSTHICAHLPYIRKYDQWIGLRENLQETIDFPIKYGAFL